MAPAPLGRDPCRGNILNGLPSLDAPPGFAYRFEGWESPETGARGETDGRAANLPRVGDGCPVSGNDGGCADAAGTAERPAECAAYARSLFQIGSGAAARRCHHRRHQEPRHDRRRSCRGSCRPARPAGRPAGLRPKQADLAGAGQRPDRGRGRRRPVRGRDRSRRGLPKRLRDQIFGSSRR